MPNNTRAPELQHYSCTGTCKHMFRPHAKCTPFAICQQKVARIWPHRIAWHFCTMLSGYNASFLKEVHALLLLQCNFSQLKMNGLHSTLHRTACESHGNTQHVPVPFRCSHGVNRLLNHIRLHVYWPTFTTARGKTQNAAKSQSVLQHFVFSRVGGQIVPILNAILLHSGKGG